MNKLNTPKAIRRTLNKSRKPFVGFLTLLLFLQMVSFSVFAQTFSKKTLETERIDKSKRETPPARDSKIAPDLKKNVDEMFAFSKPDKRQKVIIKINEDKLRKNLDHGFIVSDLVVQSELKSKLVSLQGKFKKSFSEMGMITAELPLSKILELAKDEYIEYISPDQEINATGHLENTTGTAQIRSLLPDGNNLDGEGITIAFIDSGIADSHRLLNTTTDEHAGIIEAVDFTGDDNTDEDPFGHGTHIAAVATGHNKSHSKFKNGNYRGIAPMAEVINLRALDESGRGSVSNAIAAIDWAIANKDEYNIRIINMSLGTVASDSYINDPLCIAARRAFDAGIVVVASAGNKGKDSYGNKMYGGISSPGIEPTVITVGASNTFGTDVRLDDAVTSFSSRGPTRGYVTLSNGEKKFDNLIKPDLVAPGNRIITADSPDRNDTTSLIARHPSLWVDTGWGSSDQIMYLSGTSVAAPVVSGTVALILQANPKLTPNMVKAILQYSAQTLNGYNTFEQGAGMVNVDGAVRLALLVRDNPPTSNGADMLKSALPSSQKSVIWGQNIFWGKGVITNYGFLYGDNLMKKYQGMYGNGVVMGDATPFINGSLKLSNSLTYGVNFYPGAIRNNGVMMGDGEMFADGVMMGDGVTMGDGVVMGDGILVSDGVIMGDGVMMGDAALGDNTSSMQHMK